MNRANATGRRRRSLVLTAGLVLLAQRRGLADDIGWQGTVGSWFTASNWADKTNGLDQVPGDSDFASIDNGGEAEIASGNATAEYFQLDDGELSLSGGTLIANGAGGYISEVLGVASTGILTQTGGINTTTLLSLAYGTGSIGDYELSTGTLIVTNTSDLAASEIIGQSGNGTFTQTGGNHTVNDLTLGYSAGGTGAYTLSGTGSLTVGSAAISGAEFVGYQGVGVFNQSGGTHTVADGDALYLGGYTGATGTYSLSNTGSLSVSGVEVVGYDGVGNFTQSGGSNTISSGNELDIGGYVDSVGTYTLSGGSVMATGSVFVGGSSSGAGGSGTLTLSSTGSLAVTSTLQVFGSGVLNIHGGTISVGDLEIATGGVVDVGESDSFIVNYGSVANQAVADGAIRGYLITGYNNGLWNGTGGISSAAAAASGGKFAIGYADGNVDSGTPALANQIFVECTLVGDCNLDGTVNLTDLLSLLNNYGESERDWAEGDFNYDGTVNLTDLLALLNNYGESATATYFASALHASAVPEPATGGLMCLGAANLLTRRRRRRY